MTAVKTKPHRSNIGNKDPLESSSPTGKLLLQTFALFNRSHRPANRVALLEESTNQPHRYIAIAAGDEDLFFPSVWFYDWHVNYRGFGKEAKWQNSESDTIYGKHRSKIGSMDSEKESLCGKDAITDNKLLRNWKYLELNRTQKTF